MEGAEAEETVTETSANEKAVVEGAVNKKLQVD